MTSETAVLIRSLIVLVDLLVTMFLEKTTRKDSKNSSRPSSQTEKDESATTVSGSKGRGKTQTDERFSSTRTKETVVLAEVTECGCCGRDLTDTPCKCHERRTLIDIIFVKDVKHVDSEIKECPDCESETKGEFPKDMPGPLQYGDGLKAYIICLVISQMVSLNRAQKMVATLIGETISEHTIIKFILNLHAKLEDWENCAKVAILKGLAMHSDETSLRVNKKNWWIHVYSSGTLTLKFLHRKRGREAVVDIDIIPRYGGVVIHDCWAAYFSFDNCLHALCGSHLLRELAFIIETNGYRWARNMKKLLKETCKLVSGRKRKKLTSEEFQNLVKRYRNIVTRGKKELPAVPTRSDGKRGKIAKSDAHNLLERMDLHEQEVLLFAKLAHVSFTNNRAERDLRMGKVKQKVSGCFRSEEMAYAYCRITSYLETMANRGLNPLIAIQMALAGQAPTERGE